MFDVKRKTRKYKLLNNVLFRTVAFLRRAEASEPELCCKRPVAAPIARPVPFRWHQVLSLRSIFSKSRLIFNALILSWLLGL